MTILPLMTDDIRINLENYLRESLKRFPEIAEAEIGRRNKIRKYQIKLDESIIAEVECNEYDKYHYISYFESLRPFNYYNHKYVAEEIKE